MIYPIKKVQSHHCHRFLLVPYFFPELCPLGSLVPLVKVSVVLLPCEWIVWYGIISVAGAGSSSPITAAANGFVVIVVVVIVIVVVSAAAAAAAAAPLMFVVVVVLAV